MNAIQILSSQPWVERLGWTLVHFLWQGIVDRGPVRRRTQSGETHFEPEHALPVGLRGTRSHDGRTTRHVEPDAAAGRGSGLRGLASAIVPSAASAAVSTALLPFRSAPPRPA